MLPLSRRPGVPLVEENRPFFENLRLKNPASETLAITGVFFFFSIDGAVWLPRAFLRMSVPPFYADETVSPFLLGMLGIGPYV